MKRAIKPSDMAKIFLQYGATTKRPDDMPSGGFMHAALNLDYNFPPYQVKTEVFTPNKKD